MDVVEGDRFQIVLEMTGTHDNINLETIIKIHKVELYNSDCAHLRGIVPIYLSYLARIGYLHYMLP